MSFESDHKAGPGVEGSSSLFHEAVDHVWNTWSNVLSGKASAQEYAEAAVEASIGIAAGAFAFKQGAKLFCAEARAGVANPDLLSQIRTAAKGDVGISIRNPGLPGRVADADLLSQIRTAAKGDLTGKKVAGAELFAGPVPSDLAKFAVPIKPPGKDAGEIVIASFNTKFNPAAAAGAAQRGAALFAEQTLGVKPLPQGMAFLSDGKAVLPRAVTLPGGGVSGEKLSTLVASDHMPLTVRIRMSK